MAEQGERAEQKAIKKPGVITRRNLLRGAGAVAGLAMAGVSREVHAETPTGTPTPSVTPNPFATPQAELVNLQLTAQAVDTEIALRQKSADTQAAIDVKQEQLNALKGTPTKTPTPNPTDVAGATAKVEATRESAHQTRVAAVEQTVTAEAKRPPQKTAEALGTQVIEKQDEATVVAKADAFRTQIAELNTPTSTPVPPPPNRIPIVSDALDNIKENGFPVKEAAGAVFLAAQLFKPVRNVEGRVIRGAAGLPGRVSGAVRWVRTKLHI